MKIEPDTVVTVDYKLADPNGKPIDSVAKEGETTVYLHGGHGGTLPKIEAALEGREPGDKVTVTCEPSDAFGERDESLVRAIAKADFPPGVKVGGQLEGRDDDGNRHVFTVLKIKGDQVLLDGNHALAGRTLRFALTVRDVRRASAEEISHGHVHGAHGHHH